MSSSRKRRYENRLTNQRTREQQVQLMQSWNDSLMKTVYLIMIYPKYDTKCLLTYQPKKET